MYHVLVGTYSFEWEGDLEGAIGEGIYFARLQEGPCKVMVFNEWGLCVYSRHMNTGLLAHK